MVKTLFENANYLQNRLSNRDSCNHPIRPEVFLDESYRNVKHGLVKTKSDFQKVVVVQGYFTYGWCKLPQTPRESSSNKKHSQGRHSNMLLQLVKAHKDKPRYIAQQVANEHGHSLVDTPPYHPELQNIEMVWGRVKPKIARQPAENLTDLSLKLTVEFARIRSKNWHKFY
ncbi:hypothetical protein PHMEG_00025166 [Phytophthora megakarya]|uniref:Tc1-like transposase DDE domain-containing protein n=1 Tax=Phytophthora megakarya TaxID=4795 RepID=A0A225VCB5_9STRA|nr:hypothetical protein PHMEG_00025166 [Phytophthora megakarya]